MILVVSATDDMHTQAVQEALTRRGIGAKLLDLSDFPQAMTVAMQYGDSERVELTVAGEERIRLSECRAVWWRRPQPFQIDAVVTNPAHRAFAYTESVEAFAGLWKMFDAVWVNDPTCDEVAARKPYQLRIARELGLTIPRTLVTNDPREAEDFIESLAPNPVVYKAFSATEQTWRETRILARGEEALLKSVRYAPLIFQEYVPLELDLRVTVVGERIFATAIHSKDSSYEVDCRMDLANATVKSFQLPDEIEHAVSCLMRALGLIYGAIDMRMTPAGQFVFLEINPAGQWLFAELRSGQRITDALASLLGALDEGGRQAGSVPAGPGGSRHRVADPVA